MVNSLRKKTTQLVNVSAVEMNRWVAGWKNEIKVRSLVRDLEL